MDVKFHLQTPFKNMISTFFFLIHFIEKCLCYDFNYSYYFFYLES